jgi:HPt (histidine-containing phosphotransfer) domain-containing protein
MQGDRELALESGMNDYLPKPFDVSAFEKTLNSWLKKASVAAQSLARAPMAKEHVYPVFEVDKVLFRFGGDLEMATLMVREGLSDLHQQISVLASVLAAGDVAAARRVAHTMKGMADSVGGEALREVALGAGKAVAEEDLLAAGAYIPQLEAELARLDTLASAWLTDHGAASDA